MSDTAQGPGWWLASDGKWYPPELWTGPPNAGPAGMSTTQEASASTSPGPAPVYGAPPTPQGAPSYGSAAYGAAWPLPTSDAPYPPSGGGAAATPKTNGLAVASLICSCAGLFFLPIFPGIILGFIAHSQIKRSNGMQRGDGLAIAGIIVGFGWFALIVLGLVLDATKSNSSGVISAMTVVHAGPAGLVF